ncbi:cyclin dependent kinase inhibitor 1Ca [Echeneis naucrates]|uniref:cyclin dependent kinase inhibitor 1Ca n=1 Tax=Echeneis naucrates TaxID=173247 RepID=UPI001113D9B6|nr:cyclin-dependent kinase inhibitor 1B-like [Echeneis naucrates]
MNSGRRTQPACRSLFGPVDHEQLRKELRQRLREMEEQDSRRWNFDFHTNTPLSGRFEWEETAADRGSSGGTREEEEEDNGTSHRQAGAGPDQENCSRIGNTHDRPAEGWLVRRKRSVSRPARATARITDFFTKRRRTTETRSIHSPAAAALCKTIR